LDRLNADINNRGDTLFLYNAAKNGGAVHITTSANVYAAFGDIVFQGNIGDKSGMDIKVPNAMRFENLFGNNVVTLSAFDNYMMRFYDPMDIDTWQRALAIRINGALAEATGGSPEIDDLGHWAARQTGTVLLDTYRSDVYFESAYGAQVCNGTMALHNGASFGTVDNTGRFTLHEDATLRIAYCAIFADMSDFGIM
jgi:predicted outer membrane repeat protein